MTNYRLQVGARIVAQTAFWRDAARVRGYVGGIGSGKTFAGAVEVLRAPPNTVGMVLAPTYPMLRDAAQRTFFDLCPRELVASHNKTENHTRLANGVEILWRSADAPDSLRGPNLHWAWGDEWAYATEAVHRVVMGRLRRGAGRFWYTTTPNGLNWLYEWSLVRELGYSIHYGATADNLYLSREYVDEVHAAFADDPLYAAQELEGRFVDLSGSKRLPSLLVATVAEDEPPLHLVCATTTHGDLGAYSAETAEVWQAPVFGSRYLIGADPAEGVPGGDDSAAVVVHVPTGEVVATLAGEHEPTDAFPGHVAALARWYNNAAVLVERNNHGHAVLGTLARHNVHLLTGDDGRVGWRTTAQSKAEIYRATHSLLLDAKNARRRILRDGDLVAQLKSIDRDTLKAPGKGKRTKVDDKATAYALAAIGLERLSRSHAGDTGSVEAPSIMVPPDAW